MTVQTLLTTTAIITVTLFIAAFIADLATVIHKAWSASKPTATASETEPEPTPAVTPPPVLTYANLSWVHRVDFIADIEEVDVVAIAKSRQPVPVPVIQTLDQTPEAIELEQWLTVAPVAQPDYAKMPKSELSKLAYRLHGIKGASRKTKQQLLEILCSQHCR